VPHPVPSGCTHRAKSARHWWPPVVAAPRGLAPLTTAPDVTKGAVAHFALSPHSFGHAPRCSAPCRSLLHRCCPSPMSCPELSNRTKKSTSSPRPSYTDSLLAAPAGEAGPRDFPAVVFLHEHLTGGSLLRLFPHPVDPAASSASPRSSSLGPSPMSPPHRHARHHRIASPGEHPLPGLPS
jgi:hypothetical protein